VKEARFEPAVKQRKNKARCSECTQLMQSITGACGRSRLMRQMYVIASERGVDGRSVTPCAVTFASQQ